MEISKKEFYIVKCGYSEDGDTCFNDLPQKDIEILEATFSYEEATRRLLYSLRWDSPCDLIWLEVYDTSSYSYQPNIYFYNFYGFTEQGKLISPEMNYKEHMVDISEYYCTIDEIEHYVPEEYKMLYKQLVMEYKLTKN